MRFDQESHPAIHATHPALPWSLAPRSIPHHFEQHLEVRHAPHLEDSFVRAMALSGARLVSYIEGQSELQKRNLHEAAKLHIQNPTGRSLDDCHHVVHIFRLTSTSFLSSTVELLGYANVGPAMTEAILSAAEYPLRVLEVPERSHASWAKKSVERFHNGYANMAPAAQRNLADTYKVEAQSYSGPNALQSLATLADFDRNMYQQIVMHISPVRVAQLVGVSEEELLSTAAYTAIVAKAQALLPAIANPFTHWHEWRREKKKRKNPYYQS